MTVDASIVLSKLELEALTGFKSASRQLAVLRHRGFHRAYIGPHGLILERAHYEAIAGGKNQLPRRSAEPNLAFMRGQPKPSADS